MFKLVVPLVILVLFFTPVFAQDADLKKTSNKLEKIEIDTSVGWESGGSILINFNQTSLSNYWASGGQNSIALNGALNLFLNYHTKKVSWENNFDFGYGLIRQGGREAKFVKSDDRIDLTSKFGRKINKKLYYTGLLNFKTQFAPGYSDETDSIYISRFFAPAYGIVAFGIDAKPTKGLSFLFAPITGKTTFVLDDSLSNEGTYGLNPGQKVRFELGMYGKILYSYTTKDKKTSIGTKLELFSNYFENFGNIDVNWENSLSVKATKFLAFNFSTQLIYDDDIMFDVDRDGDEVPDGKGPRLQFKQILGVGITYKF